MKSMDVVVWQQPTDAIKKKPSLKFFWCIVSDVQPFRLFTWL